MIIGRINGGLGNQMFQYAAGRALAVRAQQKLKLDTQSFVTDQRRPYRLHLYPIVAEVATQEEIERFVPPRRHFLRWAFRRLQQRLLPFRLRPIVAERSRAYDPSVQGVRHSAYMSGSWQSERYFQEISELIRRELTLPTTPDEVNRSIIEQMTKTTAVCLHVRRGDYAHDPVTQQHHGLLSLDYYRAAIQRICDKVIDPHFFVFSDEIEWVKEKLEMGAPTTYVDHNRADQEYEDLRLMSHCRHHIIANSSFSWWGAWLAHFPDKIVIAPQQWYNNPNLVTSDRYPNGWIIL